MLARTRVRRFAVGALSDEKHPYGPDCRCIGPIAVDCDGCPVEIQDSPSGHTVDRLTNEGESSIGLPVIAVYVEQASSAVFDAGQFTAKLTVPLALTIEIFVTETTDYKAEDALDMLQERVMYRLMRQTPVEWAGGVYDPLLLMQPSQIITETARDVADRRLFVRTIEITVDQCDSFEAPVCAEGEPLCTSVNTPLTREMPI